MTDMVKYQLNESVATITLDDGKVNVLGPTMQSAINEALDRAEKDSAKAVVLTGNQRVFSGGFDLAVFQSGDPKAALGMLAGGFELSIRCLTFPAPVIMAATGPAIAMGSFLLLSGDHRVGQPKSRCQAIEVAIGMTIPISAIEIMRARLTPAAFHRGTAMAATFAGDEALVSEVIRQRDGVAHFAFDHERPAALSHKRPCLNDAAHRRDGQILAVLHSNFRGQLR